MGTPRFDRVQSEIRRVRQAEIEILESIGYPTQPTELFETLRAAGRGSQRTARTRKRALNALYSLLHCQQLEIGLWDVADNQREAAAIVAWDALMLGRHSHDLLVDVETGLKVLAKNKAASQQAARRARASGARLNAEVSIAAQRYLEKNQAAPERELARHVAKETGQNLHSVRRRLRAPTMRRRLHQRKTK
jgi:hypothetical protein